MKTKTLSSLFERTSWQHNPWARAHFVSIRDSFIEQFKPQGGIDYSMIDMLAVNFFLWMHWTEEHLQRLLSKPRRENAQFQEYKRMYVTPEAKQWGEGDWDIPYQTEAEAISQAAQMADRFRRAYQSQLRSMRDWRRYNGPVIVQNAEQVNVASDGGQQINLQSKPRKKTR